MSQIKDKEREKLFEDRAFRNFLFDIMSNSSITQVARDEQSVLFIEGRRSLGLEILSWFGDNADPLDTMAKLAQSNHPKQGTSNDHRHSNQ